MNEARQTAPHINEELVDVKTLRSLFEPHTTTANISLRLVLVLTSERGNEADFLPFFLPLSPGTSRHIHFDRPLVARRCLHGVAGRPHPYSTP